MKLRTRLLPVAGSALAAAAAYRTLVAPRLETWGATPEEVLRTMPGDELVPIQMMHGTRAITIDAPPEDIWPWLVQIGYHRAGFYSYALLERTMGLTGIENANAILPEYQQLKLGDVIPFGPGPGPGKEVGLPVVALQQNRHLAVAMRDKDDAVTWAFGLYPIDAGHTRLVSRNLAYMPGWTVSSIVSNPSRWRTELPMKLFLNLGGFLMVRKTLLGVKCRAERLHAQRMAEAAALVLSSGCE